MILLKTFKSHLTPWSAPRKQHSGSRVGCRGSTSMFIEAFIPSVKEYKNFRRTTVHQTKNKRISVWVLISLYIQGRISQMFYR